MLGSPIRAHELRAEGHKLRMLVEKSNHPGQRPGANHSIIIQKQQQSPPSPPRRLVVGFGEAQVVLITNYSHMRKFTFHDIEGTVTRSVVYNDNLEC